MDNFQWANESILLDQLWKTWTCTSPQCDLNNMVPQSHQEWFFNKEPWVNPEHAWYGPKCNKKMTYIDSAGLINRLGM